MSTAMPPWPTSRNTRAAFEARFGVENADFLQEAMNTGDPLADALGVPFHHETYMKLGRYISSVRGEQAKLRNSAEDWKLAISAGMKSSADRLGAGIGGQTSYQAAAAGTLDSHLI